MGWYGDYSSANEVIEEKKGTPKWFGNRRYQSNEDLWNYPFKDCRRNPTILTASSSR